MTPQDVLRMQNLQEQERINNLRKSTNFTAAAAPYLPVGLPIAAAALYGANALASGGDERWDRTAANTLGNLSGALAGAGAGYKFGVPGAVVGGIAGALGGGYASDAIANQFDENDGRAIDLLNAHLGVAQGKNPYEQEAMLREQLRQQQIMQRQQQQAMREQAMQQYQGQQ
jgi:hypothetical protein